MKRVIARKLFVAHAPAAFGRLCVETQEFQLGLKYNDPAAFGRLCVETKPATDKYGGR